LNPSLKDSWADLSQKFTALNARERWMIFGAVLCVFYGLYSYSLEPVLQRQQVLKNEISQDVMQRQSLEQQLAVFTTQNKDVSATPEQLQVQALQDNIIALNQEIENLKNTLIRPEKMPDLLSDLLHQNEKLTLVSLKTLPPKGLFEEVNPTKKVVNQNDLPIFKHGVEISIKGHYLDLLNYITGVEDMPWHVLWDKANLEVESEPTTPFPLSQITLTVYTLSLDKNWLSI
jgi:MSHA biogenesis protein MshJ